MLVLRTVAMPKDTNPNGDIFGGWIMAQMDLGGGVLAKEVARGRVVTVTADKLTFVRPVKVGDTVCVYGEIKRIGRTSTDIHLETWTRALVSDFGRPRHLVTTGTFRYVAIDKEGQPRTIPSGDFDHLRLA
jgi:acyl-CoA thioesterase YciA